MAYVNNDNDEFISGGTYSPAVDTLPSSAESILYTLNYSEEPLEFSVEIINPDEAIPFEQVKEIKEWLFGQDGWKRLLLDDSNYKGYYLNCLLIPDSDIVDGSGYRGLRCTIKNISGFWYKDEVISFDSTFFEEQYDSRDADGFITIDLHIDGDNPGYISPIIEIDVPTGGSSTPDFPIHEFVIHNNSEELDARFPDSELKMFLLHTDEEKTVYVDTRYGTKEVDGIKIPIPTSYETGYGSPQYDWFYLTKGENRIKINVSSAYTGRFIYNKLSINYVGMYRIGGF